MRSIFFAFVVVCAVFSVHGQERSANGVDNVDTPVKILEKPRAAYARQDKGPVCVQGSVRLKIAFLSTGEIGAITPITRLPHGLTENAIEAAKKIKFVPAMKDGKPVTKTQTVDYSFTIY